MSSPFPVFEPEDSSYSIEFVAKATGLSSETILHYQEHGLIEAREGAFDDEALHTLRRIDHLREACGTNLEGVKLILRLMEEVEQLRAALRARR